MPTISGIRRRGVTPEALRAFCHHIGITKYIGLTDVAVLEHAIREDFNKRALRRLAVLRPLKVSSRIFPKAKSRNSTPSTIPKTRKARARGKFPFSRELLHRARRFHGNAAAEIFPAETRRRSAAEIRLHHQVRRSGEGRRGNITELRCTADLDSKTGGATSGRKVKGTIHWVSAAHAVDAEVRLYDRLFTVPSRKSRRARFQIRAQPALARSHHRQMRALLKDARRNCAINSSAWPTSPG
jgi:glutaminyl-tRNA synthetase